MNEQQTRQELYDTMVIHPGIQFHVDRKVDKMISNKARYENVSHHFPNPGLKWWLVALLHEMECEQDFTKYLGNGQSLNRVTTIVPKGRGPFDSFEDGAIDAIKLQGLDEVTDWSIGNLIYVLEGFNGFGYEKLHHMNSPYAWAGSNHYIKGKYTSDGHFDPDAVSGQIGFALLLKTLLNRSND